MGLNSREVARKLTVMSLIVIVAADAKIFTDSSFMIPQYSHLN